MPDYKKIMKSDVNFITEDVRIRPGKSEVFRLWCDNSKIKKMTGYMPKHTIEEGLEKTVEWFRKSENLKKYKADIYNV